jgi:hypothetical protein
VGQTLPHLPQLLPSVLVLVHVVPVQTVCPVGQPQVPPEHVCPVGHTLLHLPQLLLSVLVLVHVPLHDVWPVPHPPPSLASPPASPPPPPVSAPESLPPELEPASPGPTPHCCSMHARAAWPSVTAAPASVRHCAEHEACVPPAVKQAVAQL